MYTTPLFEWMERFSRASYVTEPVVQCGTISTDSIRCLVCGTTIGVSLMSVEKYECVSFQHRTGRIWSNIKVRYLVQKSDTADASTCFWAPNIDTDSFLELIIELLNWQSAPYQLHISSGTAVYFVQVKEEKKPMNTEHPKNDNLLLLCDITQIYRFSTNLYRNVYLLFF